MKPIQFYKGAFFVMLLLNITNLLFIAFGPHHPPPNHTRTHPHAFLQQAIQMLGLDAEQEILFKESAQKHSSSTKAIEEQQEKVGQEYFHTLLETNDEVEDSLVHQLQQLEKDKIVITYEHFEEVKTLLNPNQQANFSKFLDKALQILIIHSDKN